MTKHSKNNTASSVFSYAEYKKAGAEYGTKRQRLGNESMRKFDACALCLHTARDPVCCNEGHLYCRECVLTDILSQKKAIKKQKERLAHLKKEAEEERAQARQAARERVLEDFEKDHLGLSSGNALSTAPRDDSSGARGKKRKFEFDSSKVEALAKEAEETALRQIEREQAESLKAKLPDFWLPSLTPTYSSTGPPTSLQEIKVQTTCAAGSPPHPIQLKSLSSVKFSRFSPQGSSKVSEESLETMCPSCKKPFSNNLRLFMMRPCGHVLCKTCTDSLVRPQNQCVECDQVLEPKDVVELKREGTGYAGGGQAEAVKSGTAFQG